MAKENSKSNNTRVAQSPARNTRSPPARAKTPISSMINNAFNRLSMVLNSPERAKKHVRRKLANGLNSREIARINAAKAAQNLNKKRKEAIRTSLNAIKKAKEAQKKAKNKNAGKK